MRYSIFLSFIFTFILLTGFAQEDNKVFEKVEITANTNQKAWTDYIRKAGQLPDTLLKAIPEGTYKVTVQFIVDIHGNIGQVNAIDDPGFGLAERAVKALSKYPGEWKPAIQCGRAVKSYRKQTITYVIPAQ